MFCLCTQRESNTVFTDGETKNLDEKVKKYFIFWNSKNTPFTGVNSLFALAVAEKSHLVTPTRIELVLPD
jgi:hypothetical protein